MALTVAKITGTAGGTDFTTGNKKRKVRTITFDSSYLTAGEALTPATVGMRSFTEVIPHGPFMIADRTSSVDVAYDYAAQKLVAYWGNAGTASVAPEVTSTTDLSGYSGRLTFVGT
jgi:hypothetical protein